MTEPILHTPYTDLFREIGLKLKSSADARLNELGLNSAQGRMIGYIYENQDQGVIQKDLAEQFKRRGASITSMLQGLEKKGYIARVTHEKDERQKRLTVLEKGVILVEEFNQMFADVEAGITRQLTKEEAAALLALLSKVNQSL